jgi:hypothetical protein
MTPTTARFAAVGAPTGFPGDRAPDAALALISLFILAVITPGAGAS